jgi:hypothetical protein
MKKIFLYFIGVLLLIPVVVPEAFGINIETFREEVYRPENLPTGDLGGSAENKIAHVINFFVDLILYASGAVAVFMLVFAGVMLITSIGNSEKKEKAVKMIKMSATGLFVVILAYAIVTNVINFLFSATT